MNRLTSIKLCGEEYPLLFSILSMEEIYDAYGDMSGMMSKIATERSTPRKLREIIKILGILNHSAVEYLKAKGKEAKQFDADEVILSINPIEAVESDFYKKMLDTINAGSAQEVEVETDLKNAEAKQG